MDDEAIRELNFSAEQSNRVEIKEVGSRYGGEQSLQTEFWWGNTNGRNRSEKPRTKWKNIKMDVKEIGLKDVD